MLCVVCRVEKAVSGADHLWPIVHHIQKAWFPAVHVCCSCKGKGARGIFREPETRLFLSTQRHAMRWIVEDTRPICAQHQQYRIQDVMVVTLVSMDRRTWSHRGEPQVAVDPEVSSREHHLMLKKVVRLVWFALDGRIINWFFTLLFSVLRCLGFFSFDFNLKRMIDRVSFARSVLFNYIKFLAN